MFDIIYVTWFVHITTAFISSKFWLVYLVVSILLFLFLHEIFLKSVIFCLKIPAYAAYKLVPMAMSYFGKGGSNASEETKPEGPSKRQAKLEKRQNKGQVKYSR